MKQVFRMLLIPLALLMFVAGFITGKWVVFGIIGIGLLTFTSLFYSGRKQRVRYWLQGYKTQLEKSGGNEESALNSVKNEFCASKYAEESICNGEYQDIDKLVEDIIKKEFKFERIIQSSISSPNNLQKDLLAYKKASEKVRIEIATVKKEIF